MIYWLIVSLLILIALFLNNNIVQTWTIHVLLCKEACFHGWGSDCCFHRKQVCFWMRIQNEAGGGKKEAVLREFNDSGEQSLQCQENLWLSCVFDFTNMTYICHRGLFSRPSDYLLSVAGPAWLSFKQFERFTEDSTNIQLQMASIEMDALSFLRFYFYDFKPLLKLIKKYISLIFSVIMFMRGQ